MKIKNRFNHKLMLAAFLSLTAFAGITSLFCTRLVMAQVTNRPPALPAVPWTQKPLDLMSVEERAHYAITDPEVYCAELAKYKTAEQFQVEEESAFAITQPAAFCAELNKVKTPERLLLEANATLAILQPEIYNAEVAKQKTAEQLEDEVAAAFAIQHPQIPKPSE